MKNAKIKMTIQKLKRIFLHFALSFCILMFGFLFELRQLYAGFKDVSSDVEQAAKEFTDRGLFGFFIRKYGMDVFRPDGMVTRADMLLVLREYHRLTDRLFRQDAQLLSDIKKVKDRKALSNEDKDEIFQELQEMLDAMLKNSDVINKLKQRIILMEENMKINRDVH
jgi:hypothetical protein